MKIKTNLLKGLTLISMAALLGACAGGGAAVPTRKKMPEFNSYADEFEGPVPFEKNASGYNAGAFAFSTSNVELMLNGVPQNFVAVALPDAATDSAAISLINNIKPFALPLISAWAHEQQRGVAIDLAAHNGAEVHRTDFMLNKAGDFAIPVIITWDAASAPRMETLRSLVNGLPAVQLNQQANGVYGK